MPSLYLLIPIAMLLVLVAAALYWWAVRSGQYDDLDREADRILFEDDHPKIVKPSERAEQCKKQKDDSAGAAK